MKVYLGMRVCKGGNGDKKSVQAGHLMSFRAVSSLKRQLPSEMPPSAFPRFQCDLTFLPNVAFMPSQMLLDLAKMDGNSTHVQDFKIKGMRSLKTGGNDIVEIVVSQCK